MSETPRYVPPGNEDVFAAMRELQARDDAKKKRRIRAVEADDREQEPWEKSLRKYEEGGLKKDPPNCLLVLANHPDWKGCLSWCDFGESILWGRTAPQVDGIPNPKAGDHFTENHFSYVQAALCVQFGVCFARDTVTVSVEAAAKIHRQNRLTDWLSSLEWDRKPRIETWLADYLGAERNDINRSFGAWWLISAVARAFRPGCQVDHMLVLEGAQEKGKSTAARILGGEDWYLGQLGDVRDSQKAAESLRGKWIVEVAELDAIRGAEQTRVKDFLTRTVDVYRPPYARLSVTRPRHVVFLGTTNEDHYLHDATGARRYWPVKTVCLDRESLRANRDQLWAEAVVEYQAGARWWPLPDDLGIRSVQEARFDRDEWEVEIGLWAENLTTFTVGEALVDCLKIQKADWTRAQQMRTSSIFKRLGYKLIIKEVNGKTTRLYSKPYDLTT